MGFYKNTASRISQIITLLDGHFLWRFLRNSVINILSIVTTCSTCGSLLCAVDTAFSASAALAPLVATVRYSSTKTSKLKS